MTTSAKSEEVITALAALHPMEPSNDLDGNENAETTEVLEVHIDENNKNDNKKEITPKEEKKGENECRKEEVTAPQSQKPMHYRITRRSTSYKEGSEIHTDDVSNNYNDNIVTTSDHIRSNENRRSSFFTPRVLTPLEEEKFRICIILITSWSFLIISILFLVCYVYQLEWSPDTADPIHVFSLELAVNMLYLMFVIDIISSVGIILSHKDHVEPFKLRIFWPSIAFLILNQIHGTLIWLWVWTGEFPRTCARNSYYLGRRCENLEMLTIMNPDGILRLSDCKCDYGSCVPECKGLRLVQNYFWGTYWQYIIRMVALVIYIPRLNETVCQCKWCCCIDLSGRQVVPEREAGGATTTTINNIDEQGRSQTYKKAERHSNSQHNRGHTYHKRSRKYSSPVEIEMVNDDINDEHHFPRSSCGCSCDHNENNNHRHHCRHHQHQDNRNLNSHEVESRKDEVGKKRRHTVICCDPKHSDRRRESHASTDHRPRSPVHVLIHSSCSDGHRDCEMKNVRHCKVIKNTNESCDNDNS